MFAGSGVLDGASVAAGGNAGVWVILTAIVFIVGLYWERVAAFVLGAAALGAVGFGTLHALGDSASGCSSDSGWSPRS